MRRLILATAAAALLPAGATFAQPVPPRVRRPPTVDLPKPLPAAPGAPVAPPAAPVAPTNPAEQAVAAEKSVLIDCPQKIPAGKKFKWDLRGETDLAQLVQWASATLCRPVIVPQNLRQQKVTIYAPGLIAAEEAQRMFLSALASMGLTVQPQGSKGREIFTIIESNLSHERPVPLLGADTATPSNDSFVTKILRLKNVGTDEIQQVLNRLKSKDGDIAGFAPTGTLIITDLSENIRRMEQVVKQLDTQPAGGEKIWVKKLHNVSASEMAAMLEKIFPTKVAAAGTTPAPGGRGGEHRPAFSSTNPPGSGGGESSGPVGGFLVSQIIPEDRSNSLIIVATERAYAQILGLINRLDQAGGPLDSASDRVHVYFLANANAEDMAGTLAGLGVGVARGRSTGGSTPGRPTTSAAPTTGASPSGTSSLFESEVRVAPDKPTNSLVIVASGKDYITLRDLIRKLDITRRQVFIEATILEVSLDKARKLGLAFHGGDTVPFPSSDQQSLIVGGLEPNSQVNSLIFSPAALTGLAAGLRGPSIPHADTLLGLPAGTSVPSFGVFIQAVQNNNDVNVISMPHILTSDNEKATIQVGQNLPFPGSLGGFPALGGLAGGAPGGTPGLGGLGFGTSVQRQDVALKMEVTPHVNDSDFVRLELDAEISDVSSPNYNGLGPATDKRTAKTVVVVRDQQPVVIGGLIKDRVSEAVDKVPLLGDIPILGYLFKYTTKTVLKQNLLIILTPYVIKDPSDLRRIFERKVAERREFLERFSAFQDDNNYEAQVDYRRKRGLLEEINRTAVEAAQEASELHAAEAAMQGRLFEGSIEPAQLPTPPPKPAVPPPAPGIAPPPVAPPPAPGRDE